MLVGVTGASGFVGRALVPALVEAGYEVVAVPRAGLSALAGVDAVCHLAAQVRVRDSLTDPLGTWDANLGGTLAVLDALPPGARLVLASTAAVVDGRPPHPYAASKLAADLAARDATVTGSVGVVSLRLANVAGPGDADRSRLVPAVLAATRDGATFTVNGDGSAVRDLVHVADAAAAFVAAVGVAEPGRFRAVPIGSGRPVSIREVLASVERVTGRPVPVRYREAAPEPTAVTIDPTAARDELGWVPRRSTIDEIVRDTWSAVA